MKKAFDLIRVVAQAGVAVFALAGVLAGQVALYRQDLSAVSEATRTVVAVALATTGVAVTVLLIRAVMRDARSPRPKLLVVGVLATFVVTTTLAGAGSFRWFPAPLVGFAVLGAIWVEFGLLERLVRVLRHRWWDFRDRTTRPCEFCRATIRYSAPVCSHCGRIQRHSRNSAGKECASCANVIWQTARVCFYCGRDQPEPPKPAPFGQPPRTYSEDTFNFANYARPDDPPVVS